MTEVAETGGPEYGTQEWRDHWFPDERPEFTIRWFGNRYILVRPDTPTGLGADTPRFYVFGIEQGGPTREEALFWAERWASKQDFKLVLPDGWENVEPKLPSR